MKLHTRYFSNFASESLGELVYIEYNFEPGEFFNEGDEIVSVESVKALMVFLFFHLMVN